MDMFTHFWVVLLVLGLAVASVSALPAQTKNRCFLVDNGRISLRENPAPSGTWDAGFSGHISVSENRSITIGVRAEPGKKYILVPGFCETQWSEPGKRIVNVTIEGEHKEDIDIFAKAGGQNIPYAVQYTAEDSNGDGWIKFEVSAAQKSKDENAILSALWVFEKPVDINAVITGKLNETAYAHADVNSLKPSGKRIESIGDGRLCIGNGYWLAAFVGPIEEPEEPVYQVHDKISRLWLGYASSQLGSIGMAPRIKDLKTGKEWLIGACDNYKFEDGVVIMETKISVGTVRTETYGLWDKPVMIRRISFTPNDGITGDFQISTDVSLYQDSAKKFKDPEYVKRDWCAYAQDERERPPRLAFPSHEDLSVSKADSSATWIYDNPLYRKVVIGAEEPKTKIEILNNSGKTKASFEGEDAGSLRFTKECGAKGGTLTVVLAFDKQLDKAKQLLTESKGKTASLDTIQKRWQQWFDKGAAIKTGNKKLDQAYRVQSMYWKIAQDADYGGIIVGGRYQITTVWTRDSAVAISSMLDAGHYDEARKALRFFSKYAYWNQRNNCLNANTHSSGRVVSSFCGNGQDPVENILQPGEWAMQMAGPQLDGMGYYLYNIGKYYRCTGDKDFIKEEWPFIIKVADSLAADNYCISECGKQGEYTDNNLRFKKYNPETGLIVDNCLENGRFCEMMLASALASCGFRQAYTLSQVMGEAVPLWNQRADELDAAIQKQCVRKDDKGDYLLERPSRPWLSNGDEARIGASGFAWTLAATVPYYNYTDQFFKNAYHRAVSPNGGVGGWGMWYATLGHAAFEADQAATGWNYLKQVLDQLPESLQLYEHNQDVTGEDGISRHVALSLFGFSYLPHAVIRGFAGLGYNEKAHNYYFRPQVPDGFGATQSHIRIGNTSFDVTSSGNGDQIAEFKIDGVDQTNGCVLDSKYIDGGKHTIVISMRKS